MNLAWNPYARLADSVMAVLAAFVLVSAVTGAPRPAVAAEVAGAGASAMLLLWRHPSFRVQKIGLAVITVLLAGVWAVEFYPGAAVCGEIGWSVFWARRLGHGEARDDDLQTRRLASDLAMVAVAALIAVLAKNPSPGATAALAGLGVAARLLAMHRAQVISMQAQGAGRMRLVLTPLVMLFAVGVGVALMLVVSPSARTVMLWGMLAGFGVYVVVQFWRDLLVQLLGAAAALGLLVLLLRWVRHKARPRGVHSRIPKILPRHRMHPVHAHLVFAHWGIVVLTVAVLTVTYLILQALRSRPEGNALGAGGLRWERSPLPSRRRRSRPPTALRRLVVRWLDRQARRGRPIVLGETLRNYGLKGWRGDDPLSRPNEGWATLEELIARYERERYGDEPTPLQTVRELSKRLDRDGLW